MSQAIRVAALTGLLISAVVHPACSQGTWSFGAPMPAALIEHSAAAGSNGLVYAFGGALDGYPGNRWRNSVYAYDPASDSWSSRASMPVGTDVSVSVTAQNGLIYVYGGVRATYTITDGTYSYNPATDTWASLTPMPAPRYTHAAAAGLDGKVYAFGGTFDGYFSTHTCLCYDPISNAWSTIASMPTARFYATAATAADGHIYVMGGMDDAGNYLGVVEVYDPSSNTWSTAAPMTSPRKQFGAAVLDGRIYVIGGDEPNNTIVDTVEFYDPNTNTWSPDSSLLQPSTSLAVAASMGKIFALGGESEWNGLGTSTAQVLSFPSTNHPPVLTAPASVIGVALQPITFTATATDADGDAVTFSLIGAPAGASINAATGAFIWTPPAAGTFTFQVQAMDSHGATDTKSVTATVQTRGQAAIDSASIVLTRNGNVVTASYDLVNKASVAVTNVVVTSSTLKNTQANQPLPGAVTIPANGSVHESAQFTGVPAGGPVFLVINLSFDGGTLTFKKSVTVP